MLNSNPASCNQFLSSFADLLLRSDEPWIMSLFLVQFFCRPAVLFIQTTGRYFFRKVFLLLIVYRIMATILTENNCHAQLVL
jgi:hypothetical protein